MAETPFKSQIMQNRTRMLKMAFGAMSSGGIVEVAVGDRVFITADSSGVNPITNKYGNFMVNRL